MLLTVDGFPIKILPKQTKEVLRHGDIDRLLE